MTGDKQETAINIGVSCRLIADKKLLILGEDKNSINVVLEQLAAWEKEVDEAQAQSSQRYAVIVTGKTIPIVLDPGKKKKRQNDI